MERWKKSQAVVVGPIFFSFFFSQVFFNSCLGFLETKTPLCSSLLLTISLPLLCTHKKGASKTRRITSQNDDDDDSIGATKKTALE